MLRHLRRLGRLTCDAWHDGNPLPWSQLWAVLPVLWRYRRHELVLTATPEGQLRVRQRTGGRYTRVS